MIFKDTIKEPDKDTPWLGILSSFIERGMFLELNPNLYLEYIEFSSTIIFCKQYHYSTFNLKELTCMGNELSAYHYKDLLGCPVYTREELMNKGEKK